MEITNLTATGPIYLASPNYPFNYPPNVDCVWLFIDDTPGTYIITIIDFATEWWDNFMVGYGTTVSTESQGVRISVWYFPKTFVVQELSMWVRFASNIAVQFSGFLVEVERKHEQGMRKVCLYKRRIIRFSERRGSKVSPLDLGRKNHSQLLWSHELLMQMVHKSSATCERRPPKKNTTTTPPYPSNQFPTPLKSNGASLKTTR